MQSTHLPASWVESLFGKLAALYGDQFLRKWEHVPKADLLQTWAEGLGPYADDGEHRGMRLKWALSQLRDNNPFPPSLPEFIALVRQAPRGADARRSGGGHPRGDAPPRGFDGLLQATQELDVRRSDDPHARWPFPRSGRLTA